MAAPADGCPRGSWDGFGRQEFLFEGPPITGAAFPPPVLDQTDLDG